MKYVLTAAAVCAADLAVKNRIEAQADDWQKTAAGGKLLLRKYHNRGAALNLGESRSRLVAAASLGMTGLTAALFVRSLGEKGTPPLRAALAVLTGGALSNTYDRLARGYVVDYCSLNLPRKKAGNLVFNLADLAIVCGALACSLTGDAARLR